MNLQRISKLCAVNFYYSCLYKYEYVDLCRGEESIRKWGGGGGRLVALKKRAPKAPASSG